MTRRHEILVLSDNAQRRARCVRELGARANVSTSMQMLQAGEGHVPDLIVTDKLPITEPLGSAAQLVSRGEIVVVGIGIEGPGDAVFPEQYVVLSEEFSASELRLACRLSFEIVRLRRRLAEELRTQQALRKMAYRDPLTGLGNRRKWDQELVTRLEGLRDAGPTAALGIVLLDLDLFKSLNDRLGHVVGDTTLQRVAHKLAANLAEQHLAARLGGDEFGVLLSGLLSSDIPEVADLIRRSVEYQPEETEGDSPPVTTSSGVVVVRPADILRPLDALAAADRALRAAKQQGRNRTVTGSLS